MLKTTNKQILRNLFIFSTSIEERVNQKIQHLTFQARQAYYERDYEKVAELGDELIELSPRSEHSGLYFYALSLPRLGRLNDIDAQQIFHHLADQASPAIRSASFLSLGLKAYKANDLKESLSYINESSKITGSQNLAPLTYLFSQSVLSAIQMDIGDHKSSLLTTQAMMQEVYLVGRYFPGHLGYELNNYAYNLYQAGEYESALYTINKALQLPCSSVYPEWADTRHEIQAKLKPANKSQVFIPNLKSNNVAYILEHQAAKTGFTENPEADFYFNYESLNINIGAYLIIDEEKELFGHIPLSREEDSKKIEIFLTDFDEITLPPNHKENSIAVEIYLCGDTFIWPLDAGHILMEDIPYLRRLIESPSMNRIASNHRH